VTPTVSPMTGTVVQVLAQPGDIVRAGRPVVILESMKMEHEVLAGATGTIRQVAVAPGDTVAAGDQLLVIEDGAVSEVDGGTAATVDAGHRRVDLAEVLDRQALVLDEARPEAVARRHGHGHRTARENLTDLCDPGTFVEYGALAIAAQRDRRSLDDLLLNTPADGFIGGTAHVNGDLFGEARSRCVLMSYDYMVLAGTQGYQGHRKKDRLFELA
jgi:pyruvate/2-oxoglutarate dehydrogenase complex dihydrolipoamide acyltransferase (E2) component